MHVHIGPYLTPITPHWLATKLLFWLNARDDERVDRVGDWLAGANGTSFVSRACEWIEAHRTRTVRVRIDAHDAYSADATLACIILPLLQEVQRSKHGAPFVDDDDVPEELRSTSAPPLKQPWDTDDNHFARWDWVLDEMIWAFSEHLPSGEGTMKFFNTSNVDNSTSFQQQLSQIEVDRDGLEAWEHRKQNGFRLFGKYYQCLWT